MIFITLISSYLAIAVHFSYPDRTMVQMHDASLLIMVLLGISVVEPLATSDGMHPSFQNIAVFHVICIMFTSSVPDLIRIKVFGYKCFINYR